jgi:hypothetical protein
MSPKALNSVRWLLPCLLLTLAASGCSSLEMTTNQALHVSSQATDASSQSTRRAFNASSDSSSGSDQQRYQSSLDFLKTDLEPVRREAARGHGDELTSLSVLLHTGHPQQFARWMQANYQPLFTDLKGPRQLLNRIYARRGMVPPSREG